MKDSTAEKKSLGVGGFLFATAGLVAAAGLGLQKFSPEYSNSVADMFINALTTLGYSKPQVKRFLGFVCYPANERLAIPLLAAMLALFKRPSAKSFSVIAALLSVPLATEELAIARGGISDPGTIRDFNAAAGMALQLASGYVKIEDEVVAGALVMWARGYCNSDEYKGSTYERKKTLKRFLEDGTEKVKAASSPYVNEATILASKKAKEAQDFIGDANVLTDMATSEAKEVAKVAKDAVVDKWRSYRNPAHLS